MTQLGNKATVSKFFVPSTAELLPPHFHEVRSCVNREFEMGRSAPLYLLCLSSQSAPTTEREETASPGILPYDKSNWVISGVKT